MYTPTNPPQRVAIMSPLLNGLSFQTESYNSFPTPQANTAHMANGAAKIDADSA